MKISYQQNNLRRKQQGCWRCRLRYTLTQFCWRFHFRSWMKEPAQFISTHQRIRRRRRNKIFVYDKEIIEQVEIKSETHSISLEETFIENHREKKPESASFFDWFQFIFKSICHDLKLLEFEYSKTCLNVL